MSDSFWLQTTPDARCPSLTKSCEADVVVIGGGLTGLHTALALLELDSSLSVLLIEAHQICSGASGRTMGKLATNHSRIYPRLTPDAGAAYAEADNQGFNRILELVKTYEIECDLQHVSHYIFASTEAHTGHVRKDYEAFERFGIDIDWFEPQDITSQELPMDFLVSLKKTNQAIYHPRKFALGVMQVIQSLGGRVYEHTAAVELKETLEGVTVLLQNGASIKAKKAVVATRVGIGADEPYAASLSFWRSYLAAYPFEEAPVRHAYTRYDPAVTSVRPNDTHLVIGGSNPKALKAEEEKHYQALDAWVQNSYPKVKTSAALRQVPAWWGEDADSADRLPLIGLYRRGAKHSFMATGYCGWGMTKSAFAGIMLANLVRGENHPYQSYFDPWRF
ncbi:MAG: NAD(P)/FAD-dependent oxidoreductase [Raoultibacter sp.]